MKPVTTLFIIPFFMPSIYFAQGIAISKEQPQFWEYKGKTVLLPGGSVEDNLFQTPLP